VNANRILVASSAAARRRDVRASLHSEHYEISETATPTETIAKASFDSPDLLIMDSVVDGTDAHRLCAAIRTQSKVGILVLGDSLGSTAGSTAIDALNAGADEYLSMPFGTAELAARVRAMLRRVARRDGKEIVLQDRAIDMNSHRIKGPDGQVSRLTPKEYFVLRYLITHANKPRTHRDLAQAVWQRDGSGEVEYVRVVINQLRRKLEPDPAKPRYLLTERAVGYRLRMPVETRAGEVANS
jgi:two-component system KDP operon response regulator KdpE